MMFIPPCVKSVYGENSAGTRFRDALGFGCSDRDFHPPE
jgi:hypothetical protein